MPQLPAARDLLRTYRDVAFGPEVGISAIAGITAAFLYVSDKSELLLGTLYAELQAAAALLGIVLAALAVVVAFLGDEYLTFLTVDTTSDDRTPNYEELHRLIFVFWFTCVLAVVSVAACLGSIWLVAAGGNLRIAAGASTLFFSWALLASLGLVRFVANHLLIRSAFLNKIRRR